MIIVGVLCSLPGRWAPCRLYTLELLWLFHLGVLGSLPVVIKLLCRLR